jgi:cytidylate kinase
MSKYAAGELKAIAPIVDRQIRRWTMALETMDRLPPGRMVDRLPQDVRPYVAISREAGAGGGEIGHVVAERLAFECFDHEILSYLAERHGLPEGIVHLVDETTSDWLRETLRSWLDRRAITQDEYVMHLGQLLVLAARHGSAVFVGRGAQFLLPRERGLAVRVTAPLERRIARTMERQKLARSDAAARVRETDEGRSAFVRRYFHADIADPGLYDLVVNLDHLDDGAAVAAIAATFRARFPAGRA